MKLSVFTHGRDNNFNLIRMVAASSVLITHSFVLAGKAEPFVGRLGMSIGVIAVDVFFITSGFLVTASLLTRQSVTEFIWARILRIFPALWVMLAVTVFGLGLFFTSLPPLSYLTDSMTYTYLLNNATLIAGMHLRLPGVFESNPIRRVINGSLWTMPAELRSYAVLAVVWLALRPMRGARLGIFKVGVVMYAVLSGFYVLAGYLLHFDINPGIDWSFMFFTGAAFYLLRDRIVLSRLVFWLIVIALSATQRTLIFYPLYILSLAYIILFLAYVPKGWIRKYNLLGDYSYGVYIYAFPVQQSVAALFPGVSVLSMLAVSASITIVLAVLSWHILEWRALGLKGVFVGQTRRMFPSVISRRTRPIT